MNERSEAQQWMGGVPSEVFASSFGTFSADAAPNTTPSSASGRRAKHNSLVR
jgi:hypothetical protein